MYLDMDTYALQCYRGIEKKPERIKTDVSMELA